MVAYSFKDYFAPQIVVGEKNHTVRQERSRHARPGEAVQLYTGMRTRNCIKILDPDPICSSVLGIVIETSTLLPVHIAGVEIDGRRLHRDEIEEFARKDGFDPDRLQIVLNGTKATTARENMGLFWRANHPGVTRFLGVVIHWKAADLTSEAR